MENLVGKRIKLIDEFTLAEHYYKDALGRFEIPPKLVLCQTNKIIYFSDNSKAFICKLDEIDKEFFRYDSKEGSVHYYCDYFIRN